MRLVCPNCEAKYEVPEDAIPETGRDVQCANCGHAWYQMRPRSEALAAAPAIAPVPAAVGTSAEVVLPSETAAPQTAAPEAAAPETAAPETAAPETDAHEAATGDVATAEPAAAASVPPAAEPSVVDPGAVEEAAVDQSAAPLTVEALDAGSVAQPAMAEAKAAGEAPSHADPAAGPADEPLTTAVGTIPAVEAAVAEAAIEEELSDTGAAMDAAAPVAYAVDESVLAILREEAAREADARRAEAARPLETQVDLGIETVMPAPKPPEPESLLADTTRRTRLPDVEEINSTLRPAETYAEVEPSAEMQTPAESRGGFRSGFLLVLTVAILGSALYGSADALAEAVPALAGPLKAYVGFVDSLRLQLDGLMQSATVAIGGN